uniref:Uncharacterized protein n=1 Tax=Chlamydomonas leiostraca TaxID=1034604 RepID=A0A7S0RWP3_9CHLO|mmetsp:Transcript_33346/g.84500  ORF Transcript_33346/g.84500 Transcript_33346/m.84500 type:complete len:152 (+) Transcript_33346:341-796(+)
MGVTATAGAKAFSHTFSLALTLAVLTNLTQYTWHKVADKAGTHWQRHGPVWLLAVATPLLCADLMRHCLQDAGIWPAPGSSMYRDDCDEVAGLKGLRCLTLVGWIFSILCTYSGFIMMVTAVVWSANLHGKIHAAWSQISIASGRRTPLPA